MKGEEEVRKKLKKWIERSISRLGAVKTFLQTIFIIFFRLILALRAFRACSFFSQIHETFLSAYLAFAPSFLLHPPPDYTALETS